MSAANDNITDDELTQIYARAAGAIFDAADFTTKRGLPFEAKQAYNVIYALRRLHSDMTEAPAESDRQRSRSVLVALADDRVLSHGAPAFPADRRGEVFAQTLLNMILPPKIQDKIHAMRLVRDVLNKDGDNITLDTDHYDEQFVAAIQAAEIQLGERDFSVTDMPDFFKKGPQGIQ